MSKFAYKGKTNTGKMLRGEIESESKNTALMVLRNRNITVTSIEPVDIDSDITMNRLEKALGLNKPRLLDLLMFCRQMSSLLKSGVPITQAIKIVAENMKNAQFSEALDTIKEGLGSGKSLNLCMSEFKYIFPPMMLSLVGVGENTGNLDTVFKQLAVHFERDNKTKRQVMKAFRYPVFVVLTLGVAIVIINMFVIPAFTSFFDKFGSELPLPTKILIASSNIFMVHGKTALLVVILLLIWWRSFLASKSGRLVWDRRKLSLPLVGGVFKKAILARFSRTFALVIRSGVPLLEGIKLIAKSSNNAYVDKVIMEMKFNIEKGESLTNAAQRSGLFSTLVMQMLSVGEQTGELERLLGEVADFYEEELDYDLNRLSSSIEPILISMIAVIVLILALGIFLPMWDLSSTIT